jgi:hypothetical protein
MLEDVTHGVMIRRWNMNYSDLMVTHVRVWDYQFMPSIYIVKTNN